MRLRWNQLVTRSLLWLSLEILLSILNLDTLADYGEFLIEAKRSSAQRPIISLSL